MSLFDTVKGCVVCQARSKRVLCRMHTRAYHFNSEYKFFCLNSKVSVSKPQTAIFEIVRDYFHKSTYQEVIFEFNLHRRYDIVVPELKCIIEYDGEQHFRYSKHFHKTRENFEEMKKEELIKENTARAYGYNVIRFAYIEDVYDKEHVIRKLKAKGITNG